jgi:hypothetical protein
MGRRPKSAFITLFHSLDKLLGAGFGQSHNTPILHRKAKTATQLISSTIG